MSAGVVGRIQARRFRPGSPNTSPEELPPFWNGSRERVRSAAPNRRGGRNDGREKPKSVPTTARTTAPSTAPSVPAPVTVTIIVTLPAPVTITVIVTLTIAVTVTVTAVGRKPVYESVPPEVTLEVAGCDPMKPPHP
jgi:hypothetical protein